VKIETIYQPTDKDKMLKVALIKWRAKIHHDRWGRDGDVYLGPSAMVSNAVLQRLLDLAHVHAIQIAADITNNIQSHQVSVDTVLNLTRSIIPTPAACPATTTVTPESNARERLPVPVMPESNINPLTGKKLRQCHTCWNWGHISRV